MVEKDIACYFNSENSISVGKKFGTDGGFNVNCLITIVLDLYGVKPNLSW